MPTVLVVVTGAMVVVDGAGEVELGDTDEVDETDEARFLLSSLISSSSSSSSVVASQVPTSTGHELDIIRLRTMEAFLTIGLVVSAEVVKGFAEAVPFERMGASTAGEGGSSIAGGSIEAMLGLRRGGGGGG